MARKPKLKKFKPPTKVSAENMAIRERIAAYGPSTNKWRCEYGS